MTRKPMSVNHVVGKLRLRMSASERPLHCRVISEVHVHLHESGRVAC